MSEEEKKAIDWFREDLAEEKENCGKYNDYKKQVIRRNERLINLILKQDTEINKLKQLNEQLKSELGYTRKIIYTGDHIPRID